jgi:hypothetical protein
VSKKYYDFMLSYKNSMIWAMNLENALSLDTSSLEPLIAHAETRNPGSLDLFSSSSGGDVGFDDAASKSDSSPLPLPPRKQRGFQKGMKRDGPRGKAIRASHAAVPSESNDDSSDMVMLDSCVPGNMRVVAAPPATLGPGLVGRQIVFRWRDWGWACGVLVTHHPLGRGKGKFNYDVDYPLGAEEKDSRGHRLQLVLYSGCKDAPLGSWALLK